MKLNRLILKRMISESVKRIIYESSNPLPPSPVTSVSKSGAKDFEVSFGNGREAEFSTSIAVDREGVFGGEKQEGRHSIKKAKLSGDTIVITVSNVPGFNFGKYDDFNITFSAASGFLYKKSGKVSIAAGSTTTEGTKFTLIINNISVTKEGKDKIPLTPEQKFTPVTPWAQDQSESDDVKIFQLAMILIRLKDNPTLDPIYDPAAVRSYIGGSDKMTGFDGKWGPETRKTFYTILFRVIKSLMRRNLPADIEEIKQAAAKNDKRYQRELCRQVDVGTILKKLLNLDLKDLFPPSIQNSDNFIELALKIGLKVPDNLE